MEVHLVVAVHHDGDSDGAGGQIPGRLPRNGLLAQLVLVVDFEHLAEVLPQVVTRGPLDGSAGAVDVGLHYCGGVVSASELLSLGLHAFDHRHGQQVLVHLLHRVMAILATLPQRSRNIDNTI